MHAASGTIESVVVRSRSGRRMSIDDVLAPRGEDLVAEQLVARVGAQAEPRLMWPSASVGRMPIITMWAPDLGAPWPRRR